MTQHGAHIEAPPATCPWPTEGDTWTWDCHQKGEQPHELRNENPRTKTATAQTMTRYTELRHAGYYADGLTDHEREQIAAQVDGAPQRTETPKGSTTSPTKRSRSSH